VGSRWPAKSSAEQAIAEKLRTALATDRVVVEDTSGRPSHTAQPAWIPLERQIEMRRDEKRREGKRRDDKENEPFLQGALGLMTLSLAGSQAAAARSTSCR
jgi:hypothetical protein